MAVFCAAISWQRPRLCDRRKSAAIGMALGFYLLAPPGLLLGPSCFGNATRAYPATICAGRPSHPRRL
jgi:hypothetical protein